MLLGEFPLLQMAQYWKIIYQYGHTAHEAVTTVECYTDERLALPFSRLDELIFCSLQLDAGTNLMIANKLGRLTMGKLFYCNFGNRLAYVLNRFRLAGIA